ncbi:peroxiredoxin-like family protein [Streptomyces silvensis]|uniref:thioredoxin-dependent peroxiredoxin n=1 Tax=Streptomyces silvensis TaxID=1765722 RepID=A0A0W7XAP0_9ACTN|nr:peroxiredoxin-like family protein [Streptomyces silvensis]KUF19831.1 alkyl hydroperoxide reductase [Streptomyces silvensis]
MTLRDELRFVHDNRHVRLSADRMETMDRNAAALAASGIVERAARVGDRAPDFTLGSATGRPVSLSAVLADGPVVLTFYRGAWCPFCNLALRALQAHHEAITARGARLLAVSPQIPDESLSLTQKEELAFDVLSDIGSDVAERYGIAFDLGEELGSLYDELGFELERVNDGHARTLPLPATYVIDRDGVIRWAFVASDYAVRAEPSDILAALDTLDSSASSASSTSSGSSGSSASSDSSG